MRNGWLVVRGAVGAVIGSALGALGGEMAIVAMGGIIGLALGLAVPDRNQAVIRQRRPSPPQVEEEEPDAEVWPPPPRSKRGR